MYLSITGITPDNHVTKYQPCETEAEAITHAAKYDGFVIPDPGSSFLQHGEFWTVDPVSKAVTHDVEAEEVDRANRAADQVQDNRRAAYQDESDHLHFEEARGEVSGGTWAAKVAEIKARFPKD